MVLRGEGVPEQVLQNAELMTALLPTLRADFELCDTYEYRPEAPLGYPLSVFGGVDDVRVAAPDLQGWRDHTTAGEQRVAAPRIPLLPAHRPGHPARRAGAGPGERSGPTNGEDGHV